MVHPRRLREPGTPEGGTGQIQGGGAWEFRKIGMGLWCLRKDGLTWSMPVSYYVPGEERARKVSELFASIAHRYDLINDVQSLGLHRLWKRKLVRLAPVGMGARALDVCCGTGDIALALAEKGFDTAGVDFCEPMLTVARTRAQQTGRETSVQFIQGDALGLSFPDGSFDVITMGYGLRNLSDWKEGLKEMLRVLKPGGTLMILEFGKPPSMILERLWFGYLKLALPVFGGLFAGNHRAYAYILESLKQYPGQKAVDAELQSLGVAESRFWNLLGGMMALHVARKESERMPPLRTIFDSFQGDR